MFHAALLAFAMFDKISALDNMCSFILQDHLRYKPLIVRIWGEGHHWGWAEEKVHFPLLRFCCIVKRHRLYGGDIVGSRLCPDNLWPKNWKPVTESSFCQLCPCQWLDRETWNRRLWPGTVCAETQTELPWGPEAEGEPYIFTHSHCFSHVHTCRLPATKGLSSGHFNCKIVVF